MECKITLQFLQNLISQTDSDVTVLSFKVTHGAGRGDNYTSMLYRVLVRGERGAHPWQRSLIIKMLPDSQAHRDLYRSDLLFRNEVAFYKEALTALLQFQSSTGMSTPFAAVPFCLLAEQDVVVLEDLQVRGFVMGDRKEGLDLQHCTAVFREIGKFHALSLAMKCQDPLGFQERVATKIQEIFFTEQNEAYYKEYYSTVTGNALAMVEQGLEDSEKAKYLRKFEEFLDEKRFFKTMMRLSKPTEPLAVLGHGDCWTNNIMFRYTPDGSIEEVCLVDFQCVRYCSPALDLYNFLYACTSREMRTQHLQALLSEYCTAMTASLVAMGCGAGSLPYCNTDDIPNMIQDEIKTHSQFGLGLALDMIPICTCDPALAPDLYEPRADVEEEHEAVTPFCSQYTPECQRRMTELVRDLVDLGYL